MSDFQIVQQAVAQLHSHYNLSCLDAMKWNGGLSKTATPRLRCTSSRLLAEPRDLEIKVKKPVAGFEV